MQRGIIGVYAIRNTVNSKVYVGKAEVCMTRRWGVHRCYLRQGKHDNRHLQSSWNKYGEASFEFIILERCSAGDCDRLEKIWMHCLRSLDSKLGYNKSSENGTFLGLHHSEETKAKLRAIFKGRKISDEQRAKISAALRGKPHGAALPGRKKSEEHKAKLSAAKRGRKLSLEHRAAIGRGMIGNKHLLGHVHSPETRERISAAGRRRYAKVEPTAPEIHPVLLGSR